MTTHRRKTPKLKRRKEPTALHSRGSSGSYLKEQLDLRTRELNEAQTKLGLRTRELGEALEQQAATADLKLADRPSGRVRGGGGERESPCDASDAKIHQVDGAVLRLVAHHGPIPVPGPAHYQ
jgi:hypothetical protein